MKLSELIRSGPDATATGATVATLVGENGPSVASVASVTVTSTFQDHIQKTVMRPSNAVITEVHFVAEQLDATNLRYLYDERAAICEFDGGLDRPMAEAMAWEQVATLWHRQRDLHVSGDLCAGCGHPLDGSPEVALFPRGERAHGDAGFVCVRHYMDRWRREAASALLAMGIPAPQRGTP